MMACTRRIASASRGTKASSLGTARVEHAAWCMPSPHAPDFGINHLAAEVLPACERVWLAVEEELDAVALLDVADDREAGPL